MKTKLCITLAIASLSEAFTLPNPRSLSSRFVSLQQKRGPIGSSTSTGDSSEKTQRQHQARLEVATALQASDSEEDGLATKLTTIGISAWFSSLSYFIFRNYKIGPWFPVTLGKQTWVFLHAICNMLFTGGIVLSTILEWRVVSNENPEVVKYWFINACSHIDKFIVLPALTVSIIAGFAQTALDYGSMKTAPKHIRLAIHILATFGLWWIGTDLTTQRAAKTSVLSWYKKATKNRRVNLPKVVYFRRASNVVSCFFVGALYALMALKPWYAP